VVLDLAQGSEALFKQMDKKRRKIRAALRAGVEIFQPTHEEDMHAFYSVYSAWHRTTRKKINGEKLPLAVFEQRFHQRTNFQFFLARYSGKVIAGITLRLFRGGLVEFANNSSLDDFIYLRPNDLLLWHAIEWACSEGFPRLSLGGAHRFLREFGGTLTPIYRHRLDRTWLRQLDRREELRDWGRERLRHLPPGVEKAVRRILWK
jgi:lipid II:glycine glycyltransferase (peptidoglycan interpeptide bridge formation enzyme)